MESLQQMKLIPAQLLQERLELIRVVAEEETECYRIMKDTPIGMHYLDYSYLHLDIAQSGEMMTFHQLLPLDSDDVLGIMFGGQPYRYPEAWNAPFLRNGPEGHFVWFDPVPVGQADEHEAIGRRMLEKLEQFKQAGTYDLGSVGKLLDEIDRMQRGEEGQR